MDETDVASVADLALTTRLLEQGWEPQLWTISPTGRTVHELFLRRELAQAGATGLVDTRADGAVAAVVATDLEQVPTGAGGPVWSVDELYVGQPSDWDTAGRALLVALAAKARSAMVSQVIVGCTTLDRPKVAMLGSAGLERCSWLRAKRVGSRAAAPPAGVRALVDADGPEVTELIADAPRHRHPLPLPRRFDRSGHLVADGLVLDRDDGILGAALTGPSVSAPPGYDQAGRALLADPVVLRPGADWSTDAAPLIAGLEWLAASRGDDQVVVACGPGEPAKEEALRELGYVTAAEWWLLDLRPR